MNCKICGDKQMLPFKRKDGSIVPNAWVYCSCKQDEPDHYREIIPTDFDFPVSWDFHRWICATYGKGVPRPEVPSFLHEKQTPEASIPVSPPVQRLNQIEGNLISLRDILKQHVNEPKKKRGKKWD